MSVRPSTAILACLLLFAAIESPAQGLPPRSTATGLDPSFGTGGRARINVMGGRDFSTGVAVQPDLKILVGGTSDRNGVRSGTLTRLNRDGTKDLSWAFLGVRATQAIESFTAIEPLPDGNVIAAGHAWINGQPGFGVTRLDREGRIDPTFGIGGYNYIDLLPGLDEPNAIAAGPDGTITIAGIAGFGGGSAQNPVDIGDFGIVRLDANGRPDEDFGVGGKRTASFRTSNISNTDFADSLVVRHDGRLLAGGTANNLATPDLPLSTFALIQYDDAGKPDPAFGVQGRVITPFRSPIARAKIEDMILLPDGKVLAVGAGSGAGVTGGPGQLLMARYTDDGQLDNSFGDRGTTQLPTGSFAAGFDAELLPDGRIVVVNAYQEFFAALYTPDGQLIRASLTAQRPNGHLDSSEFVKLGPDGRIVAAGKFAPEFQPPRDTPEYEQWLAANDVTVVRSVPYEQILPEPTSAVGLIFTLALLIQRQRRPEQARPPTCSLQ